MNNNFTYPEQLRHPGGVLDWSREAGSPQPHPWLRLSPEIPKTVKHSEKRSNAVPGQTNTLPHSVVLPKTGENSQLPCKSQIIRLFLEKICGFGAALNVLRRRRNCVSRISNGGHYVSGTQVPTVHRDINHPDSRRGCGCRH